MTRPALLAVNTSASWGGNEHWAVRTARGMAERGHPVTFLYSHEVVGERVKQAGLQGRQIRPGGDLDPRGILALRREMARTGARAVLLTRWREYLQGGLAARLAGRPRVVLRLGLKVTPPDDVKRRLIFRLADRVIVNAPEIADTLAQAPWFPADKLATVINGTDLPRWPLHGTDAGHALGRDFRAAQGLDPAAPLVVNVGNLTGQKDQASLVEACRLVGERVPGLQVLIIGEGPERPRLEQQIQKLGLQETVRLTGFAADVAPALAAADLFVLSSRNEGMARALVEAAACGLPAVTTDVSGARYCVEDGASGLVVPPENPAALAEAMAALLTDPDRRREMGRKARRLAEERFDAERMVDQTARILFA